MIYHFLLGGVTTRVIEYNDSPPSHYLVVRAPDVDANKSETVTGPAVAGVEAIVEYLHTGGGKRIRVTPFEVTQQVTAMVTCIRG